jgi:hypothetical protein
VRIGFSDIFTVCRFPVGAAVGGILGGLVLLTTLIFTLVCFRRRRRSRASFVTAPEPKSQAAAASEPSPHAASESSNPPLTNEQVDFVHTLYSHNIPAPAIARVMERLISGQEVGVVGPDERVGTSGLRRGDTTVTRAPPPYTLEGGDM